MTVKQLEKTIFSVSFFPDNWKKFITILWMIWLSCKKIILAFPCTSYSKLINKYFLQSFCLWYMQYANMQLTFLAWQRNVFSSFYMLFILLYQWFITETEKVKKHYTATQFHSVRTNLFGTYLGHIKRETRTVILGVVHEWRHGLKGEVVKYFVTTVLRP